MLSQSNTTGGEAEVGVDLQMPFSCLIPPSNFQKICMGCIRGWISNPREVTGDFPSDSGQTGTAGDPNRAVPCFRSFLVCVFVPSFVLISNSYLDIMHSLKEANRRGWGEQQKGEGKGKGWHRMKERYN